MKMIPSADENMSSIDEGSVGMRTREVSIGYYGIKVIVKPNDQASELCCRRPVDDGLAGGVFIRLCMHKGYLNML